MNGSGRKSHGAEMRVEWRTLAVFVLCYTAWVGALWLPVWIAIPALAVIIALQASLQHEAIHGHPFGRLVADTAIACPPLALFVPYLRFRDTHLAHHMDARLTDPFDDPETNYLDAGVWDRLPRWVQTILSMNNTFAGRVLIGPLVGQVMVMRSEWMMRNARISLGWALHIPAVVAVLLIVWASPLSVWSYILAAYGALSILKIRTFCEHQAHESCGGRSVIIEDRGILAFLFLNNNFHVVHHMHPNVPWYDLPAKYAAARDHYLRRNGGYMFASYGAVIRKHLWRPKDPVAHPLWRR